MKTPAERKAAERARKRQSGFKAYEIWLKPAWLKKVKQYIADLARQEKP